ncbi:MAG: helix-turn-helix transcriptional regulator [Burkholderiales bacterium]
MPRGSQLARQWRLLQLLDRPQGVTVEDAARALGCAVRTIWRDLRVLEDAGFPIYDEKAADGRRGLWRVEDGFKAKLPLKLTLSEVAALVMSREFLAPLGASLLGPAVATAFEKIGGVLSRDAVGLLERMREIIGVRAVGAKLQLPAAEHLPAIQTGLLERRSLRMRYYSFQRDAETERDVDPYHLTHFNGGLYLVGYCHLREAVRVFAVERIRAVDVLRRRFEIPAGFDAKEYLDKAWGILQGDLTPVRVIFSKKAARYVREHLWHPSQRFRDLVDGRLEMRLRVADTLEVRRWILGYGIEAEVLEPGELREALRREAEGLAAALVPPRRPLARADRLPVSGERSPSRARPIGPGGIAPASESAVVHSIAAGPGPLVFSCAECRLY